MKALEERGIGRPSTYAAIMGTILDRGYVRKQGQALVPEFLAFAVVNLLEKHFAPPGRLRVHRAARGRPRRDRRRGREARRLAAAVLLRRRRRRRAEGARRRPPRRDRCARDQHGRVARHGHRRSGRAVRPVPRARRGSPDAPARRGARRADAGTRRGAARAGSARPGARRRPRERPDDRRQGRPVRPVRHRGRRRRREAAHGLAVLVDGAGDGHARGRPPAPDAPTNPWRGRRRGGRRRQRALRAVRQAGQGVPLARVRGSALHDHARRGAREARRPRARAAARPLRRSRSWATTR